MIVSRFGLEHLFFFRTSACKLSFGLAHPIGLLVGMGNLCGRTNAVSDKRLVELTACRNSDVYRCKFSLKIALFLSASEGALSPQTDLSSL